MDDTMHDLCDRICHTIFAALETSLFFPVRIIDSPCLIVYSMQHFVPENGW